MSVFDPEAFMNSNTGSDVGSTTIEPIPAGDYKAMIDEVATPRQAGDRMVMDITFLLLSPETAQKLGREKLTVRQGYFLDLTGDMRLDMSKGKNVQLNRLRDALGQLTPNWGPAKLRGAGPLTITVGLRPDKNDPSVVYNQVNTVGKA
jgi:hypothetical protein